MEKSVYSPKKKLINSLKIRLFYMTSKVFMNLNQNTWIKSLFKPNIVKILSCQLAKHLDNFCGVYGWYAFTFPLINENKMNVE